MHLTKEDKKEGVRAISPVLAGGIAVAMLIPAIALGGDASIRHIVAVSFSVAVAAITGIFGTAKFIEVASRSFVTREDEKAKDEIHRGLRSLIVYLKTKPDPDLVHSTWEGIKLAYEHDRTALAYVEGYLRERFGLEEHEELPAPFREWQDDDDE